MMAWEIERFPMYAKEELVKLIDGNKSMRQDVIDTINRHKEDIEKEWPEELSKFVFKRLKDIG